MKTISFTCVCLLVFFNCFCQNNKIGISLTDIKPKAIKLGAPKYKSSASKLIKGLIVIDARLDTTTFGFYKTNRYYSMVAAVNTADEITGFLKDYLQVEKAANSGGKTIIMVLRKLWLANELPAGPDKENQNNFNAPRQGGAIAKFEFYCSNGEGYTPLYRFDTIYAGKKNMNSSAQEYLHDVIIMSVQQLIASGLNDLSLSRKVMSLNEIHDYNKKQFDMPVINTGAYKKGVYQTFDEFKMNNPSIISYNIENHELTKTIFLNDDNGERPSREVWGYCDGNHLYIKSGDNYFELVKRQNTFISFAARALGRSRFIKPENVILFGPLVGTIGKGNKKVSYNLNFQLYELDMDTGELY